MTIFLGFPIVPEESLRTTSEWITELHPQVRPVPPRNWHLTVAFLGSVTEAEIVPLLRPLAEAYGSLSAPAVELRGIGRFPHRESALPRVLWTGPVPSEPVVEIMRITQQILREQGWPVEDRKPVPHMTIARVQPLHRSRVKRRGIDPFPTDRLRRYLADHADTLFGRCEPDGVTVYRSDRAETGPPIYTVLQHLPFADRSPG